MTRVALVTCAELPELDPDDRLLRAALGDRADAVVWDDPAVEWDAYATIVVRNPWDYVTRRDEFLAWARSLDGRLHNPADVLAWNTDKRYLGELAAAGLPVVETAFVAPGDPFSPPADVPFVVKPTVSAGSRDTERFPAGANAAGLVGAIHASGRTAMVQPYLEAVDETGETALLYLGGAYSHAIRKGPLLRPENEVDSSGLFVTEDITPREPTALEHEVADRVMAWVGERFGSLLYARVDLLPGPGGEPTLLELEVSEPSLFFGHAPGSAERLAALVD